MNCLWKDSGEPDDRGWRRVQCIRCNLVTAPTPHPHDRIKAKCKAYPFWHEFGHWLALILAAVGVTKDRYVWLKSRAGLQAKCGCQQREERLNTLGGLLAAWWARVRE
jgi:hypothetical protein